MLRGKESFILKGDICYSKNPHQLEFVEQGYVVCLEGKCQGVYSLLPEVFQDLPLEDAGNCLIVPGLTDLHIHGPQYGFRGIGMDLELLDWLNQRTFPQEAKYEKKEYARQAYGIFADSLKESGTTRACIFGTIHVDSPLILMDLMEKTGLITMVGKVNMDRNSPDYLREQSAQESADSTRRWLKMTEGRYRRTSPILTPRFTPSCSDRLMELLGRLQGETGLPLQSHLSENQGEINWVKNLCPWSSCYGEAYDRFGLFGEQGKTIMAHCVYSGQKERELMKERGVFIAHCPQSNTNLSSGIAPAKEYLSMGMNMGLGSDVAGGFSESIFRAMADAVQVSKLRWRLVDNRWKPLTVEEAFYLGTMGGGAFFGKVGSFLKDYEFDALILDDSSIRYPQSLNMRERLERFIYVADHGCIKGKFVAGVRIF